MRQVSLDVFFFLPGYSMVGHKKLILLSHITCSTLAFHGFSISLGSTSDSSVQNVDHQVAQWVTQEERGVLEGGKNE